jgi:5-(aminomethyl)-3-furanmethanol phosphate kinase
MSLDAVLKVGGSLSRGAGLETLCKEIGRLGEHYRLLIVPGGGAFADQVRAMYRRYALNETAAHRMSLLAMDQYGYLLNQLITESSLTSDLDSVNRITESGRVAILLSSALIIRMDPLPHSWEVTSDSIAAWIARQAQCRRLVLLKDVDGLLTSDSALDDPTLIAEMTVNQLAGRAGGVDDYLSHVLAASNLETWVMNGLKPERLSQLLETSSTTGTRINATPIIECTFFA